MSTLLIAQSELDLNAWYSSDIPLFTVFCTSSSMENDINECNHLSASDDDEEEEANFLDLGVNDMKKDFPVKETGLSQEYDGEICISKNAIVTADLTECEIKPDCSSISPHETINDFSGNDSRFSLSNSRYINK